MQKSKLNELQKLISSSDFDIDSIIERAVDSEAFSKIKNASIQKIVEQSKDSQIHNNFKRIIQQVEQQPIEIESKRLSKYADYDDIAKSLPFVAAAINIYVDNMTTPDNNYDEFLNISIAFSQNRPSTYKNILRNINSIAKEIRIEEIADQIAYDLYKYGDYFIEIEETASVMSKYDILIDSESYDNEKLNQSIPQKSTDLKNRIEYSFKMNDNGSPLLESIEINGDPSNLLESENKEDINISLTQIKVTVHSPKNVVIIYKDRTILGYLVIIPTPGDKPIGEKIGEDILENMFKYGLKDIKQVIKNNPQYSTYISALLKTYDTGISEIKTKYVPVEKMVHRANGKENFPYGTSRLEAIAEYAKYSIVGMRGNMLYRFTRAPSIRVFKVDIGLDTDSAKYIQQVKRELTQRKYSLNPELDVDTLSRTLTQFDDIWVPTRQGQEFFTVDQTPAGDLQSRVEDLKMLDNNIISGLQIPPVYLSLDRPEDSRYTLSQMNANFAKSIYRLNRILSSGIDELFKKIYSIVYDGTPLLNSVSVGLQKPTALFIERESEIYSNIANIAQTLEGFNVPKSYVISKLMPWIDVTEFDDSKLEDKIEKIEKSKSSENDEGENMF